MLDGWYGKIIGAILGYIIGRGLLGAFVGFVIGHQFDVAGRRQRGALGDNRSSHESLEEEAGARGRASPAELRQAFFEATFQVMGHIAKADGRVTQQEIGAARDAMQRFSLSEPDRQRAIELFTAGKSADFPLEATLQRFYQLTAGQQDLRRLFVQIQLEAALRGNGLSAGPRTVFSRICRILNISPLEFASLEAMLRMRGGGTYGSAGAAGGPSAAAARAASRLADAYDVLGVTSRASDAEVTKAYRRLMSQNHPDKLVAQGLPESMVTAAHERTQRILEAYEIVKNYRGMR